MAEPLDVVRARAPLRISFGGGGTDISPYCDERGGAVLCAGIDRYAYASVRLGGSHVKVKSLDYDCTVECPADQDFVYNGQLDLAKFIIDHFRHEHGLNGGLQVSLHNDAPPGSGLGSSSAIAVALLTAIGHLLRVPMDAYALARTAYRIERDVANIAGGHQDQYAAAFGGVNFVEFVGGHAIVNGLRVDRSALYELEYNLVFAHVGGTRFSSEIIRQQRDNYVSGNAPAIIAMDRLKALAYDMKNALLLGDVARLGTLLDDAWECKKRMADGISTESIDAIYSAARNAGALGGKIPGAGGGGFMFFICRPGTRFAVQDAVRAAGGRLTRFAFTHEGVRSWTVGHNEL